jgi:hypothetical protein
MHPRFPAALAALVLAAAPALAEPPKPAVVFQAKPVSRLLGDFREMVRQVAGPDGADRALKELDNGLKEALGEQGFSGLDTNRPLGGYVVLRDAVEQTAAVLVVPVTAEKDFIDLLGRMKLRAEPVEGKKGVYSITLPDAGLPKASVQFAGAWAYVTINGDPADPKDLVAAGDLFDNADPALATAKLYPERVPEKLTSAALDQLDMLANQFKGLAGRGAPPHGTAMVTAFFEGGPKLVRRTVETGRKEAAELAVRLGWDPAAADVTAELSLTPKAGTPLAKDVAAFSVSNRFAAAVPKDAAVGVAFHAPLFSEELRTLVAAALEFGQGELKNERDGFPKQYHPLVDEVAKSLTGSVKKGQFAGSFALAGPDKAGKFTLVGGLALDDAAAVEKAARELVKGREFAKVVQLDAEKAGAVNVHKVDLLAVFPERDRAELAKVFGIEPPGYAAFDRDAVFVALGPDALARIKEALAAKPGRAPLLDVTGNMKRLQALVSAAGGDREGAEFAKIMGTDDRTVSMLRVTAEGGQKLTAKLVLSLRVLPRGGFGAGSAVEVRPAVPPPVIKR